MSAAAAERTQPTSIQPDFTPQHPDGRTSLTSRLFARGSRDGSHDGSSYVVPESYANLDELAPPAPVLNVDKYASVDDGTLEQARGLEQQYRATERGEQSPKTYDSQRSADQAQPRGSELATKLYTISYLIFFAILGTLARLGLQGISFFPGAPVVSSELWPNFGGSLVMGFLSEDRMLFKEEWGTPTYHQALEKAKSRLRDEENFAVDGGGSIDLVAAKKAHSAVKKTIPLYIGLATGFCGCFTSFSSFVRDIFLALSNDLPTPLDHPGDYSPVGPSTLASPRNGGYSFMAILGVTITTMCVCISGLYFGAHLATFLEPYTPALPYTFTRKMLDRLVVLLAWGSWFGAICLSAWPPDRFSGSTDVWRGRATFAITFAPLGCLGRFYASMYLNGKIASFPLGTFAVNILGTAILGMSWDLQHVPLGDAIGCQTLQGVQDGFCGCLTTVSTWVLELTVLRRRHAYRYGIASLAAGISLLVVIMGSLRWTRGFSDIACVH